jgi:hypothetical protein
MSYAIVNVILGCIIERSPEDAFDEYEEDEYQAAMEALAPLNIQTYYSADGCTYLGYVGWEIYEFGSYTTQEWDKVQKDVAKGRAKITDKMIAEVQKTIDAVPPKIKQAIGLRGKIKLQTLWSDS